MIRYRPFRSAFALAALFAAAIFASACDDGPTGPSNFAPFSQTDLRVGTGADAVAGRQLTVNYTGWFYSENATDKKGPVFDTSRGQPPLSFILGTGSVIEGFDRGTTGDESGRAAPPDHPAVAGVRCHPDAEHSSQRNARVRDRTD